MDNFHRLLVPQPGWTRQATSFGRDPERGHTWWGLRSMEACIKRVLLAPGETHSMASLSGAEARMPSLSRSHWTAAPAMKMLPSTANCGVSSSEAARVERSLFRETGWVAPVCMSAKQPVP